MHFDHGNRNTLVTRQGMPAATRSWKRQEMNYLQEGARPFWHLDFVVQSLSHVQLFATPWTAHARLPCPSPTPGACSNSCPSSQWCHPTISSSVICCSCLQSCPASGSFPVSQFFASGGQSIGVLASASVLPVNIQGWFPLGWTGFISLQSKGLSRVFSNTTVQKHQFFSTQLSL